MLFWIEHQLFKVEKMDCNMAHKLQHSTVIKATVAQYENKRNKMLQYNVYTNTNEKDESITLVWWSSLICLLSMCSFEMFECVFELFAICVIVNAENVFDGFVVNVG